MERHFEKLSLNTGRIWQQHMREMQTVFCVRKQRTHYSNIIKEDPTFVKKGWRCRRPKRWDKSSSPDWLELHYIHAWYGKIRYKLADLCAQTYMQVREREHSKPSVVFIKRPQPVRHNAHGTTTSEFENLRFSSDQQQPPGGNMRTWHLCRRSCWGNEWQAFEGRRLHEAGRSWQGVLFNCVLSYLKFVKF